MPAKKAAPKRKPASAKKTTAGAKKVLTPYQKFVKKTFHEVGTAKSTAPERMKLIAKKWNATKK